MLGRKEGGGTVHHQDVEYRVFVAKKEGNRVRGASGGCSLFLMETSLMFPSERLISHSARRCLKYLKDKPFIVTCGHKIAPEYASNFMCD